MYRMIHRYTRDNRRARTEPGRGARSAADGSGGATPAGDNRADKDDDRLCIGGMPDDATVLVAIVLEGETDAAAAAECEGVAPKRGVVWVLPLLDDDVRVTKVGGLTPLAAAAVVAAAVTVDGRADIKCGNTALSFSHCCNCDIINCSTFRAFRSTLRSASPMSDSTQTSLRGPTVLPSFSNVKKSPLPTFMIKAVPSNDNRDTRSVIGNCANPGQGKLITKPEQIVNRALPLYTSRTRICISSSLLAAADADTAVPNCLLSAISRSRTRSSRALISNS